MAAKEQRAKDESAQIKDDGLVAMTKDGETLRVHPSCVADHKRLGWIEA